MPARRTIRKWLTAGVVAVSAMASTAILATPANAGSGRWEPSGLVLSGGLFFNNSDSVYCEEVQWEVSARVGSSYFHYYPMTRVPGRQVKMVDYGHDYPDGSGSRNIRAVSGGAHYGLGSSGC
jgi:hypothetical protein